MIKNITDLLIYNKSLELLPKLYGLLQKLPSSETFLINQSKRAGVSIASNIAEGFAKRIFYKEFRRYLLIALASTDELQTHLSEEFCSQARLFHPIYLSDACIGTRPKIPPKTARNRGGALVSHLDVWVFVRT